MGGGDTRTGRRCLWDLCAFLGMSVTGDRLGVRLRENLALPKAVKAEDLGVVVNLPSREGSKQIPHRMSVAAWWRGVSHSMAHCLPLPPPAPPQLLPVAPGLAWC